MIVNRNRIWYDLNVEFSEYFKAVKGQYMFIELKENVVWLSWQGISEEKYKSIKKMEIVK